MSDQVRDTFAPTPWKIATVVAGMLLSLAVTIYRADQAVQARQTDELASEIKDLRKDMTALNMRVMTERGDIQASLGEIKADVRRLLAREGSAR